MKLKLKKKEPKRLFLTLLNIPFRILAMPSIRTVNNVDIFGRCHFLILRNLLHWYSRTDANIRYLHSVHNAKLQGPG